MLVNRIRRFWQTLRPGVTAADLSFIGAFLNSRLAGLFFAMTEAGRAHCVATARQSQKLAAASSLPLDHFLLLQAALLHDAGRRQGDMTIWQRVAAVALAAADPGHARRLAARRGPRGSLSHAIYIYYQHPAIGADLIRRAGGGDVLADLVARHHSGGDAPPELVILRRADDAN
jgi:putative nucleotidyltransferase with HDIG domain